MTRLFRLPVAYAVLTLTLGAFSLPLLKNDPQIALQSPRGQALAVHIPNPQEQQQEKARLVSFISSKYSRSPKVVSRIVDETTVHARAKGIDPLLFLAVISVESSFNPHAVSSAGAVGLSQVLPRAHPEKIQAARKSGKQPTDIATNIKMGVDILAEYRKLHKGDMRLALLRYNGSLKDRRGRYAAKVMAQHAVLETAVNRQPIRAVSIVASP